MVLLDLWPLHPARAQPRGVRDAGQSPTEYSLEDSELPLRTLGPWAGNQQILRRHRLSLRTTVGAPSERRRIILGSAETALRNAPRLTSACSRQRRARRSGCRFRRRPGDACCRTGPSRPPNVVAPGVCGGFSGGDSNRIERLKALTRILAGQGLIEWSCGDLNPRPPRCERGALPDCATAPRLR